MNDNITTHLVCGNYQSRRGDIVLLLQPPVAGEHWLPVAWPGQGGPLRLCPGLRFRGTAALLPALSRYLPTPPHFPTECRRPPAQKLMPLTALTPCRSLSARSGRSPSARSASSTATSARAL